jgi:hypothetical protein
MSPIHIKKTIFVIQSADLNINLGPGMAAHPYNLSTLVTRQEDCEFEVCLKTK